MIVVREETPSVNIVYHGFAGVEEGGGEGIHAFRGVADEWDVLVAGGGDVETGFAVVGPMRWGVRRAVMGDAFEEEAGAVFGGEGTPYVAGGGHGGRIRGGSWSRMTAA
jgi:hypothetical protein